MNAKDDELNRIIDIVARDMTKADVSAGFRGRVLDAIEAHSRRGSLSVSRRAWAGAWTAVALVAVGVVTWMTWPTDRPQPQGAPALTASRSTTAPATAVTPAAASSVTMPADAETGKTTRRRAAGPRQRPQPGLAWEAGPTPLPDPDPITIHALSPAALDIPGITVAPMDDIQPITIPPAGPGLPDPQRRDRE